jgi:hypothetical protein
MPTLSYMPVTYRRRQTFVLRALVYAAVFTAAALLFNRFAVTPPIDHGIIAMEIVLVSIFLLLAAIGLTGKNTRECRVEADQLVLLSPSCGERTIPIDEIVEIVSVTGLGDTASWFEIKVRDVGQLKVEFDLMSPLTPLKDELKRINGGIRFTDRKSDMCHACLGPIWPMGEPLTFRSMARFSRERKCASCGIAMPQYDLFVQSTRSVVR